MTGKHLCTTASECSTAGLAPTALFSPSLTQEEEPAAPKPLFGGFGTRKVKTEVKATKLPRKTLDRPNTPTAGLFVD
jgi:hypothetical protein